MDDVALSGDLKKSGDSRQSLSPSNDTPEAASTAATTLPRRLRREESDDYPTLVRISDTVRVINCKDDIQWIVQGWSGGRWRSAAYCRNRDVLIKRSGATGEALAILRTLPRIHP